MIAASSIRRVDGSPPPLPCSTPRRCWTHREGFRCRSPEQRGLRDRNNGGSPDSDHTSLEHTRAAHIQCMHGQSSQSHVARSRSTSTGHCNNRRMCLSPPKRKNNSASLGPGEGDGHQTDVGEADRDLEVARRSPSYWSRMNLPAYRAWRCGRSGRRSSPRRSESAAGCTVQCPRPAQ